MGLLADDAWPAWIAALILVVAAAINARTLSVPNWLTLGGIVSGWVVGALVSGGIVDARGGLGSSLVATAIGFGLLIPCSSRGYLGMGCVKAQMAFGAWVGCVADVGSVAVIAVVSGVAGLIALGVVVLVHPRVSRGLLPAQVPLSLGSVVGAIVALMWA